MIGKLDEGLKKEILGLLGEVLQKAVEELVLEPKTPQTPDLKPVEATSTPLSFEPAQAAPPPPVLPETPPQGGKSSQMSGFTTLEGVKPFEQVATESALPPSVTPLDAGMAQPEPVELPAGPFVPQPGLKYDPPAFPASDPPGLRPPRMPFLDTEPPPPPPVEIARSVPPVPVSQEQPPATLDVPPVPPPPRVKYIQEEEDDRRGQYGGETYDQGDAADRAQRALRDNMNTITRLLYRLAQDQAATQRRIESIESEYMRDARCL